MQTPDLEHYIAGRLRREFYERNEVVTIAQELLGKVLVTNFKEELTAARIVETEAYNGALDKASHAYNNRRTNRTEVMFGNGGKAYVYLCYGIHHLFNVVTNVQGTPHAVLIRAVEPIAGLLKHSNKLLLYLFFSFVYNHPFIFINNHLAPYTF